MHMADILKYEHALQEAGVPEKQACIHATHLADIIENNLATKQDLKELEYKLEYKIDTLSIKLETSVESLSNKIDATNSKLNWLVNLVSIMGVGITFLTLIRPYLHIH